MNILFYKDKVENLYLKYKEEIFDSIEFRDLVSNMNTKEDIANFLYVIAFELKNYGKDITLPPEVKHFIEDLFEKTVDVKLSKLAYAIYMKYFYYYKISEYAAVKLKHPDNYSQIILSSVDSLFKSYEILSTEYLSSDNSYIDILIEKELKGVISTIVSFYSPDDLESYLFLDYENNKEYFKNKSFQNIISEINR